jgi:hypothetical protein
MSRPIRTPLLLAALALGLPGVAVAGDFGTNGTSCDHSTLPAAISAAGPGGTVYVAGGTTVVPSAVTIPHDVTLRAASTWTCSPAAGADATLASGPDRIFEVAAGANLVLYGIELLGGIATNGGTVHLASGAGLALVDSEIVGGEAEGNGGCLYGAGDNVVSLWGWSRIADCVAADAGGGAYLIDGSFYLFEDALMANNVATNFRGGGLYLKGGSASIAGDMIGGSAGTDGGLIAMSSHGPEDPTLTVSGLLSGGIAGRDGGAIWAGVAFSNATGTGPSVTIAEGGEVSENRADDDGGGIYVDSPLQPTLTIAPGGQVSDNVAEDNGGGLWTHTATVAMNGWIELNRAYGSGGGWYDRESTITLDGRPDDAASIGMNEARVDDLDDGGGGMYLVGSTAVGDRVELIGNEAFGFGGGVVLREGASLDLVNSEFLLNTGSTGGGLYVLDSTARLDADFDDCSGVCSAVEFNSATGVGEGSGFGGGIAVEGASVVDIGHVEFGSNEAGLRPGGALWVGDAAAAVTLKNSLIHRSYAFVGTDKIGDVAVYVEAGSLDARSNTFHANITPFVYDAGATGPFHRNVASLSDNDGSFGGTIVGNCNLLTGSLTNLSGTTNELGAAVLDGSGRPTVYSIDVLDQCSAGPADDLLGRPRTDGIWDRGAFEGL